MLAKANRALELPLPPLLPLLVSLATQHLLLLLLPQRTVLLLVSVEGLPYAEVAAVVGVPLGTVMSRISRGRDRLATLLREGERPRLRSVQ